MSSNLDDYEMGKRKLSRLTPVARAHRHRQRVTNASERLAQSLGQSGASKPELMAIAAARLENVGKGNPIVAFEFAAHAYLTELRWETGNTIRAETFWDQLLDLVEEFNPRLAQTFARDFKQQFIWCLVGHVHRLNMEYDQRPEAIQSIEVCRKGKKTILVAVYRDGIRSVLPFPDYRRLDPWVCFAGTRARPAIALADLNRLCSKDAAALIESGKFKFSYPSAVLFSVDTVFNIAIPRELDKLRLTLSGLRPLPPKLARKYGGP